MKLVASERASARFVWVLTLAYVAVTAFVAMHHEPWRDEADPWLYVRDANLFTILARTRYAGLPALWFLCLTPLAKLGLPYASQKVLHLPANVPPSASAPRHRSRESCSPTALLASRAP